MAKLKLQLEALTVESFETDVEAGTEGTVHAHADTNDLSCFGSCINTCQYTCKCKPTYPEQTCLYPCIPPLP